MQPRQESLSLMKLDKMMPSNSVGGYEFDPLLLLTGEEHPLVPSQDGKED